MLVAGVFWANLAKTPRFWPKYVKTVLKHRRRARKGVDLSSIGLIVAVLGLTGVVIAMIYDGFRTLGSLW